MFWCPLMKLNTRVNALGKIHHCTKTNMKHTRFIKQSASKNMSSLLLQLCALSLLETRKEKYTLHITHSYMQVLMAQVSQSLIQTITNLWLYTFKWYEYVCINKQMHSKCYRKLYRLQSHLSVTPPETRLATIGIVVQWLVLGQSLIGSPRDFGLRAPPTSTT